MKHKNEWKPYICMIKSKDFNLDKIGLKRSAMKTSSKSMNHRGYCGFRRDRQQISKKVHSSVLLSLLFDIRGRPKT